MKPTIGLTSTHNIAFLAFSFDLLHGVGLVGSAYAEACVLTGEIKYIRNTTQCESDVKPGAAFSPYEQCRAKAPLRPCLFAPPPLQRAQRPQQPLPCIGKTSAWMDGTFQERRRTVGSNGLLAHTFHLYQRVLSWRGAPGAESRRQCAPSPSRWMIPAPRGRIRRCPKRRCPKGG